MRNLLKAAFLAVSVFTLSACIAGGGEPYDDSESVYEPTISINETIVDDEQYTLVVEDIIRKSHADVGNMVEITFHYHNKTEDNLYLTANTVRFDDEEVSDPVMAFFEGLTPNSEGTVTAYFQDIQEQGWTFPALTKSLYMDLELFKDKSITTVADYSVDIEF